MNEKLTLKSTPKLIIARIIVFLIYAFLIFCAIEAFRGDFVKEKEPASTTHEEANCSYGEETSWL